MTDDITPEINAIDYLRTVFAKAGKPDKKYRTEEAQFNFLCEDGAQRFKRRALGLCGAITRKSLDEVAQLLVDTNIASTMEEAKQTVPKIAEANQLHLHAVNRGGLRYLSILEVINYTNTNVRYEISAWASD